MRPKQVLMIANRAAGTGHAGAEAARLLAALKRGGLRSPVHAELVDDHPAARRVAREFLAGGGLRAVVAAGGGGTLRAVVEGACDGRDSPPPGARVRVAALRMGSGNVVPKQYGVPADPVAAAEAVGAALEAGLTRPCGVLRCEHGLPGGGEERRHAVAMCGLGEWGRVPGDIERWRRSAAGLRRAAAAAIGIERVNHVEYVVTAARRFAAASLAPGRIDRVVVRHGGREWSARLLAGAVLKFRIPLLPDPGVRADEARAVAFLLEHGSLRPRRLEVAPGRPLEIDLVEPEEVEFFLDEDPEIAQRVIRIEMVGTLAFVAVAA